MQEQEGTARFQRADTLFREGQYEAALAELDVLNKAYPGTKNILFPAALCLERLGRYDAALRLCNEVIDRFGAPKAIALKQRLLDTQPPDAGMPALDPDWDTAASPARATPSPARGGASTLPPVVAFLILAFFLSVGYALNSTRPDQPAYTGGGASLSPSVQASALDPLSGQLYEGAREFLPPGLRITHLKIDLAAMGLDPVLAQMLETMDPSDITAMSSGMTMPPGMELDMPPGMAFPEDMTMLPGGGFPGGFEIPALRAADIDFAEIRAMNSQIPPELKTLLGGVEAQAEFQDPDTGQVVVLGHNTAQGGFFAYERTGNPLMSLQRFTHRYYWGAILLVIALVLCMATAIAYLLFRAWGTLPTEEILPDLGEIFIWQTIVHVAGLVLAPITTAVTAYLLARHYELDLRQGATYFLLGGLLPLGMGLLVLTQAAG